MIIALNNKCNLNKDEFTNYQKELANVSTLHQLILCPSALHIANFNLENYELGCQNVSKEETGAHTGEISASQLKSFSVKYCIVGHSERRQELKESSQDINQKIKQLLKHEIIPILCIGETETERELGKTMDILQEELSLATQDLTKVQKEKIIIAYEPIWSIGTGKIPTIEQIDEVLSKIKSIFPNNKVLYGGSANEKNIDTLHTCKKIDGYLLGGLSLKVSELKIFLKKLEN